MTIEKIKNSINDNLGHDVKILHNEGRNKIYEYRGKVVEVYDKIFIVLDRDNDSKRSFSYHDVLIETVKVSFKM